MNREQLIKQELFDENGSRYIYMVGEITAVCVSCRFKTITEDIEVGGKVYSRSSKVLVPTGHSAYIDFVDVRVSDDDVSKKIKLSYYIDEDSPVSGGMDIEQAAMIRNELAYAIELIQNHLDYLMDLSRVEL